MDKDDLKYFLDGLNFGYEMLLIFKNRKLFIQGWVEKDSKAVLELVDYGAKKSDVIWTCKRQNMSDCAAEFLHANLWNGKTFLEAEKDISISDDW